MDELLMEYSDRIGEEIESFLLQESLNFPDGYSEEDKVYFEYMALHSFYHSKNINESYYNADQNFVIQQTLEDILRCITTNEFVIAEYYIVSLQLLMSIQIRFNKVLVNMIQNNSRLEDFVDKAKYLGKGESYGNRKGI